MLEGNQQNDHQHSTQGTELPRELNHHATNRPHPTEPASRPQNDNSNEDPPECITLYESNSKDEDNDSSSERTPCIPDIPSRLQATQLQHPSPAFTDTIQPDNMHPWPTSNRTQCFWQQHQLTPLQVIHWEEHTTTPLHTPANVASNHQQASRWDNHYIGDTLQLPKPINTT